MLALLAILLPILAAVVGFSLGFQTGGWRARSTKRRRDSSPAATPAATAPLEEVRVDSGACSDGTAVTPVPAGLPPLRTPIRQRSGSAGELAAAAATPFAQALAATPFAPGAASSRPRSPSTHLTAHLVLASQAMEQMESQAVLRRLASMDTAATPAPAPLFSSSPGTAAAYLLTPAPSGVPSGDDGPGGLSLSLAMPPGDEIHMDEIDLMTKLGGGAFGAVYKGQWRGAPVAVKCVRTRTDRPDSLGAAIREVMLSKKLTHPNVLQTFSWTVLSQPEEEEEAVTPGGGSRRSSLGVCGKGRGMRRSSSVERSADVIPAMWPGGSSDSGGRLAASLADVASSIGSASGSVGSTGSRGVKRRRTVASPVDCTPSPTLPAGSGRTPPSLGLDPRMDSFNSEEGFGSPLKKKHGGVQSIFKLEGMRLEPTEALLVVVMEHCDLGSLDRAIRRRVYLPSPKWPLAATFRALLRTAAEISAGMEYIHAQGIVHGDMKPANILLKTHRADRRGYIAKVADFGLARHAAEMSIAEEGGCPAGTPAYLPPEAFDGPAAPACGWDVYAFGVILWVMWHCENPYEGLHEAQVCAGVAGGWLRPEWKPGCPPAYRALAERCWAQDPGARPSFAEVSKQLVEIELEFRSQRHRSRSGSGSFAATPAGAAMAVTL